MQCGTDVNDYSPFAMLVPLLLVVQCHNSRPQLNRLADVYKKNNAATSNLRFLCTTACVHTDSESNYALAPYAHKHRQTSKPKQQSQKKRRAYVKWPFQLLRVHTTTKVSSKKAFSQRSGFPGYTYVRIYSYARSWPRSLAPDGEPRPQ